MAATPALASLETSLTRIDDDGRALLFTEARTANTFSDRPVTGEQLVEIYELMKWGPTWSNTLPLRIVYVTTPDGKARLPFIQITIAEAHDAATKRALITGVSAAAAATGMPEEAFRVWIVEVSPNEVGADPAHPARDPWVVLVDQRAIRRAGHPAQRRSARS